MFFETLHTSFYEGSNSTSGNCSFKELTQFSGFKLYCSGDSQICLLRLKRHPGPAYFRRVPGHKRCPELSLCLCSGSNQAGAVIWWSPWELAGLAGSPLAPSLHFPSPPDAYLCPPDGVNSTQIALYICTASSMPFFLLPFLSVTS